MSSRDSNSRLLWVLRTAKFDSRTARLRGFWHYIVRGHRYEICGGCGRPVSAGTGPAWWTTDDALWRLVNGSENGVLCPSCFATRSLALGLPIRWEAVEA